MEERGAHSRNVTWWQSAQRSGGGWRGAWGAWGAWGAAGAQAQGARACGGRGRRPQRAQHSDTDVDCWEMAHTLLTHAHRTTLPRNIIPFTYYFT